MKLNKKLLKLINEFCVEFIRLQIETTPRTKEYVEYLKLQKEFKKARKKAGVK